MVVPESSINNIMGGLESTGGVTLHNHRRKLKTRFETIAKLGQGTYGKVQLGINKETGQEVAIKTIKKCKIETEADLIRIRREIQIMSSLRHPYIIHIYEVFENRDKMVLVMEYAAGGELYDYLSKKKVLDENEARRIFRQIAMAVYYCHKHQICHRDLKLENILLDENGNAKIADFGLSNVFDKSRLLSTFCGSPLYASPEIVKGIPYYGPEVDCWSLGVLLYTLVYGAMPFDGSNFKRLVRQISAGEYFEPKIPSTASELIAGLLTVKGTERLDITGVCQHQWMAEEGKVSCFRLAVELAEQEPNRLDLLLALAAPQENQVPSVPEEINQLPERPARSMSLSSLSTVQPNFAPPPPPKAEETEAEKPPEKEKKRERSSSRTRKKESDDEKPKKKSVKVKKKSDPELTREEMENVLKEARRLSEIIAQSPVAQNETAPDEEQKLLETKPEEASALAPPSVPLPVEEPKEKAKEPKKVKKVKSEKEKDSSAVKEELKDSPSKSKPKLKKEKEVDLSDKQLNEEKQEEEKISREVSPKEAATVQGIETIKSENIEESHEVKETTPFRRDSVRRKSKVFETAEVFAKSPTQEKVPQKKVFLPGVKVSDAKAAFERRSSISQDSPPESKKPEFSLASTINVNQLVQNELNKENKEEEKDKIKKENAIKVISHAISESEMNKASTLPRRRLSKPLIPRNESEHMVANTSVSQIAYPSPVPPPRPSLVKQDSGPKEHIIPIQIEGRDEKPPPITKQPSVISSVSSRTSSISSLGRQDSDSSTTTAGTASMSTVCEPIRKSPREVIIPIAVEGGGYVTPSPSTLSKMSSVSEGEDDGPMRSFGLHSTRRRVEATDSLSSDEEDDNFEMLTAENLFSTLLSRVRNLTYRLNENEGRPSFPRLFNHHSIFDSPRRLTETKSFSDNQNTAPWRRKRENASSSTLPRGFSTRSFRRTLTGGDENRREGRPPPAASSSRSRRRSEDEVIEDFLATGKLSSLDRVRSYLEGLRRTNVESPSPLRRYLSTEPQRTEYPSFPRHRVSSLDNSTQREQRSSSRNDVSNERQKKTSKMKNEACSSMNGHNMTDSLIFNGAEGLEHQRIKKVDKAVSSEDTIENKENLDTPDCSESDKLKNDLKASEKISKKDKNGSRVNKAIKSLRKKSEVFENEFTESKLLKRAVSLEDLKFDEGSRGRRATSLKPEGTFEKRDNPKSKKGGVFDTLSKKKEDREARIANLKRLDLGTRGADISAESTPTGDQDERESIMSVTDNSDTWSSCDYGERFLDPSSEECVSERIRRKSFYHRFNMPKRQVYNRTVSNLERKRYY